MSAGLRVFEAGPAGPLDIAGIERDLASLWKDASAAGKEPAMRASRANLVVVLEGGETAAGRDRLEDCVPIIARCYPARLIVVSIEKGAQAETLTASVSALCSLAKGARYVCCERIQLAVGHGAEPAVPGAILALLIGAIPVVVWTPGEPAFAASWFRTLLGSADRLMIDSKLFGAPAAAFRALDRLHVALADFEWLRLAPWRAAIAEAFRDDEGKRAAKEGFERVTFYETAGPAATDAAAATSARQHVMADESRPIERASSASLLLRAWRLRCARVQAFVWSGSQSAAPAPGRAAGAAAGGRPAGLASRAGASAALPASHRLEDASVSDASESLWDTEASRGIDSILFEGPAPAGKANGKPSERFHRLVHAPASQRPLGASDFAELIGGQRDNPMCLPSGHRLSAAGLRA